VLGDKTESTIQAPLYAMLGCASMQHQRPLLTPLAAPCLGRYELSDPWSFLLMCWFLSSVDCDMHWECCSECKILLTAGECLAGGAAVQAEAWQF
jgi:hypothetical protein